MKKSFISFICVPFVWACRSSLTHFQLLLRLGAQGDLRLKLFECAASSRRPNCPVWSCLMASSSLSKRSRKYAFGSNKNRQENRYHYIWKRRISWFVQSQVSSDHSRQLNFDRFQASVNFANYLQMFVAIFFYFRSESCLKYQFIAIFYFRGVDVGRVHVVNWSPPPKKTSRE